MAENIFLSPETQRAINKAFTQSILKTVESPEFVKRVIPAANLKYQTAIANPPASIKKYLGGNFGPPVDMATSRPNAQPFKFVNGKQVFLEGVEAKAWSAKAWNLVTENYKLNKTRIDANRLERESRRQANQVAQANSLGTKSKESTLEIAQRSKWSAAGEISQLGLMIVNQVGQSISRGFEQSARIAESMYKEMASRAISRNDWAGYVTAENAAFSALGSAKGAQLVGSAVSNIGSMAGTGTAAGFFLGGPIGAAIGGAGGAAVGTGLWLIDVWKSVDQVEKEGEKSRQRIADRSKLIYGKTGITARSELKRIQEEEYIQGINDKIASGTPADIGYVEEQLTKTQDESAELQKRLRIVYNRINKLKLQKDKEQELLNAENEATKIIADLTVTTARLTKISKSYSDYTNKKLLEAELAAKEAEQARIAEEHNAAARESVRLYYADEEFNKAVENFKSKQIELMDKLGVEQGIVDAIDISDEGKQLSKTIETQRAQLEKERFREAELQNKLNNNTLTADEAKELISLSKSISAREADLKNIYGTINGSEQFAAFKEATKSMVEQMSRQIQSSSFMSDNLGSFNQYFGKTDSSLTLISEQTSVLKSILEGILNLPEQISMAPTWQ